jgi:2-oxoglutarate ferredoxin oxidoreductase subunit alpha
MEALSWAVMAEMPLIVVNVQRGGPSTGLPTSVEQSDLLQGIFGSHGDTPRVVLAPKNVEDCFYIALEAGRLARQYSTPVLILTDQSLATRIEAFDEPDLAGLMVTAKPDLAERGADFKPYPLDRLTRHAPPGTRIASGKFPNVTGLEHDEDGHPSGNPAMHAKMTARRREKIKTLGAELALPEVHGDSEGEVLLVGWGSTWGPVREAVAHLRQSGRKAGQLHLRHLHPLPSGLDGIFARYRDVFVVEMNDEGLYGFGQLAMLLRARYANPAIRGINKTDGLTFKVSEIVDGVTRHLARNDLRENVPAFTRRPASDSHLP